MLNRHKEKLHVPSCSALQMVDKLREHLNRHLPRLGKKRIDSLVVNYVAKLVSCSPAVN